MSKEFVRPNLDGVTMDEPYRDYYVQRNGNVSSCLATYLGIPLVDPDFESGSTFEVLANPITRDTARALLLNSAEDFYGGVVDHLQHIDKTALHLSLGAVPPHYSSALASQLESCVLPGYSFFDEEAAAEAVDRLSGQFSSLRLKLPQQSDGHGQFVVTNAEQVLEVVRRLDRDVMTHFGAVIEPNLLNPQTISVGEFMGRFSFIAHQLNDIAEDGRSRYRGALITVYRGSLEQLSVQLTNAIEIEAAQTGTRAHQAYSCVDPWFARVSYDYLIGADMRGQVYGGVTDVTARVGGSCPALMYLLHKLHKDPGLNKATATVALEYNPNSSVPPRAQLFVDHPTLRISVIDEAQL